jgi:hypothetical protein
MAKAASDRSFNRSKRSIIESDFITNKRTNFLTATA